MSKPLLYTVGIAAVGLAIVLTVWLLAAQLAGREKDNFRETCEAIDAKAVFTSDAWFCVKGGEVVYVEG